MKISSTTPSYINQTYANQATTLANQNQKSQQQRMEEPAADSLKLSEKTKDLQKITRSMELNSAERQKYVNNIKQQVESNQYNVNAEEVAQKMLGAIFDGNI